MQPCTEGLTFLQYLGIKLSSKRWFVGSILKSLISNMWAVSRAIKKKQLMMPEVLQPVTLTSHPTFKTINEQPACSPTKSGAATSFRRLRHLYLSSEWIVHSNAESLPSENYKSPGLEVWRFVLRYSKFKDYMTGLRTPAQYTLDYSEEYRLNESINSESTMSTNGFWEKAIWQHQLELCDNFLTSCRPSKELINLKDNQHINW